MRLRNVQILVAALPGMLITTFITALVCQYFLKSYSWDFPQAALFGSIISATDPVAVVAILKELGKWCMLTMLFFFDALTLFDVPTLLPTQARRKLSAL